MSPDPAASAGALPTAVSAAAPVSAAAAASAVPAAVSSVPAALPAPVPGGVPGGRARMDAIDLEIIELIGRRAAVSAEIQAARITAGGRRLDLRRETEVIGRYTRELGRPGTAVAMALLELGRGRA